MKIKEFIAYAAKNETVKDDLNTSVFNQEINLDEITVQELNIISNKIDDTVPHTLKRLIKFSKMKQDNDVERKNKTQHKIADFFDRLVDYFSNFLKNYFLEVLLTTLIAAFLLVFVVPIIVIINDSEYASFFQSIFVLMTTLLIVSIVLTIFGIMQKKYRYFCLKMGVALIGLIALGGSLMVIANAPNDQNFFIGFILMFGTYATSWSIYRLLKHFVNFDVNSKINIMHLFVYIITTILTIIALFK